MYHKLLNIKAYYFLYTGNAADSDGNLESDSELKEINSYCGQDPDGDTDTNYQKQLTTIAE